MLKRITLKNFRSHAESQLTFVKGINGIIGISGSGKTNILRAIKYIFTLRPTGQGVFRRHAKKHLIIDSEWSGVGNITYEWNNAHKSFRINDGDRYRKFGVQVPEDIINVLNLSDINFHGQFDGPFLIFSPPGEISRTINKVTGADEFDVWSSNVNSRLRDLKFQWKDADFRVAKYKLEKENLQGIKDIAKDIEKLNAMEEELQELREHREEVVEIYNRLIGLRKKAAKHKKIMKLRATLIRIKRDEKRINKLEEGIDLVDNLKTAKKARRAARRNHKKLTKEYIKALIERKQCPTCYSPIKQSVIQRLENEIRLPE